MSLRATIASRNPCSSRNSARWNPSGSFCRVVCSITRGPAKPISAPGSAIFRSPIKPLYITVRDTAAYAALRDPRFHPVSVSELSQLEYEISVLSPLRRVTDVEQIKVGRDGLLMKNGDSEGLLLPQVPLEQKWNRQTFLEQTCVKAGMHPDCWKDENTDIFKFTAVVFGEHKP